MEKLRRKKGVSYRVKIYVDGKPLAKVFKSASEAKDWQAEMRHKKKHGLLNNTSNGHLTFSEFFEKWIIGKEKLSINSKINYQNIYKNHFKPLFHNKKLKDFSMDDGDLLKSSLSSKNLSNARKKTILVLFKQLFSETVKRRILAYNPVQYIELYRVTPPPIEIWSKEEIETFLTLHKEHEAIELIFFILNSGVRLNEALGLKWNKVNFETKEITINAQRNRHGFLDNSTKTHSPLVFPMSNAILLLLRKLQSEKRNDEYVFSYKDGSLFSYEHFTERVFYKLISEAGVKRITLHKLRHTFASHFLADGGELFYLSKMLNHKSTDMTSKRYAKPIDSTMTKYLDNLSYNQNGAYLALLKSENLESA